MNKIKFISTASLIGLLLCYVTYASVKIAIQKQRDYDRVVNNQSELQDSVKYYRSQSGRQLARVDVLEYKIDEIKKLFPEITNQLTDMRIKLSRVQTVSQSGISTSQQVSAHVRDTNIINNKIVIPVKVFSYRDPWTSISGRIIADSAHLAIRTTDTITQVVHYGPRLHPWAWILSRRQLVQTIETRNPNNKVFYSRIIKVKE